MRYETLNAAATDSSITEKINMISPEVVFLHLGQADLLNKATGNEVVADVKRLIKSLISTIKAKLCVSLIIPVLGIPSVKSIIRQANKEISNLISDHRQAAETTRVFTLNNDSLAGFIQRSSGAHGITLSLNERGQRKL